MFKALQFTPSGIRSTRSGGEETDKGQIMGRLECHVQIYGLEFRLCMGGNIEPLKDFEEKFDQVFADRYWYEPGGGSGKSEALAVIHER